MDSDSSTISAPSFLTTGQYRYRYYSPLSMFSVGLSDVQINATGDITARTFNGNTIATGSGTLTMGANSLNIGTGGTLGSAAFTDASAYQVPLSFSTGLTNNSNTVTSNLSTGMAGGQSVIGGTGVADILSLKGTTGNGTLTSPAIQALVGNNGGTIAMTILNNGYVGIGTTNPGEQL